VGVVEAANEGAHHEVARRPKLVDALRAAQDSTLAEMDVVRELLRRAVQAAITGDRTVADSVVQESGELDRRYADVHDQLLAVIARQAPVAGDLRLAMALVHVNDRVARMGAQCMNIAKLCCVMPEAKRASAGQLECLRAMADLADEQVAEAARSFAARDVAAASRLRAHDLGINEHNRRCFELAVHEGTDANRRQVGFFVALMARALERIGDNAVDIGQQTAFVETGAMRAEPPTGGTN
jgi:phosphate transport system protein